MAELDPELTIDVAMPFRGYPRHVELVRYVLASHPKNETDWLEWKQGLDLTKADGRFAVAKQVLGFANRDPDRAAIHAGGCSFVVVGAEPGNLAGQSVMDPADLERGLTPYIGADGPAWTPLWVDVDGKQVLVFTVEPPAWGDPIRTLRKEYTPTGGEGRGFPEGQVFVRRPGGTHRAGSADIQMLEARLLRRQVAGLELRLTATNDPLERLDLSDASLEAWLDAERSALLAALVEPENPKPDDFDPADRLGIVGGAQLRNAVARYGERLMRPERRTPDDYRSEVDTYIEACRRPLGAEAARVFSRIAACDLTLDVENPTDKNLTAVRVEVEIPRPSFVYTKSLLLSMPDRPVPWGPRGLLFDPPSLPPSLLAGVGVRLPAPPKPGFNVLRRSESCVVVFEPVDLRPRERYTLDRVPVATPRGAGAQVDGTWMATATNRDGAAGGALAIRLSDRTRSVIDLVPVENVGSST